MAQQKERSQETTSAIMQAAMRLSLAKGITNVTVRDICVDAGISVGAFYHHFASRQELFMQTFEAFDQELSCQMEQRCAEKDPKDALMNILLFQIRYMSREGAGIVSHYYRSLLTTPSSSAVSANRPYYRLVRQCLQRLADADQLHPDCSVGTTTDYCIAFVHGCLIDWCLHDQSYDIVSHVRAVLPTFIRGFTTISL